MEERVLVQDFYKKIEKTCAVSIENLGKAFFTKEKLFFVCKHASNLLLQYSLKQKIRQDEIQLPMEEIEGVEYHNNIVCFFFKGNEHLWIYKQGKILALQSHFAAITAMTIHLGSLITGSSDMTIRTWNHQVGTFVQDPVKHASSGHHGAILFLLSFGHLLLSAATDKKILVWRQKQVTTSRAFLSNILLMSECSESQQLTLYEERKYIHIVSSKTLLSRGRLDISRTIDCSEIPPLLSINEIDESFIVLASQQCIQIAEINLGKLITFIDLGQDSLLAIKCLRRLTLVALESKGLYTIKF